VPTDYDNDGWTDLFVANDSNPNFLYRNDGKGKFESTALLAGVAVNAEGRAQAGMGADSGDFDADGDLDFVLTTFAHDTVTIYRNTGGGQFEDAAQASGVAARTYVPMEWGTVFFDADADGDLDIFLADGHIYPQVDEPAHKGLEETYRQKNQLLLNDGGRYRDVSERAGAGMQEMESSRGLAAGDLDDDGDLDLVITNMDAAPTVLENRPRKPAHWAAFRLVKPGKNRFAIGARVTLTAAGRTQMREVRSGGSYMSQSDLRVHFGLGDHAGPVDVEVTLPGQGRWSFKGLPADKLSVLELSDKHRSR
jgi:enediyne biosynthesis protein E4